MPRPDGTPYTNFHFDWTGDCRDPGQAIAWLQDARSKTFLSRLGRLSHPEQHQPLAHVDDAAAHNHGFGRPADDGHDR